jgi:F420-non-reducing hydrogenase small subunit
MTATVSTEWLSGCSGCHIAIVDLHEKLLGLVEELELVRIPVLMDEKGYPKADVGIVEGAVRSEHDIAALVKMRESVKMLVAFGSCAVYGGPSGLGWLHEREAVMSTVFDGGPTNAGGERPDASAPRLEDSVVPIDEVVEVDLYLPGCPPHPYFIAAGLRGAVGASELRLTPGTVCAGCQRKMVKSEGISLRPGEMAADDGTTCMLCQGIICLGSVTLNRCQSPCPNTWVACTGCAGPSLDIITEPHIDLRTALARRMSLLTGIAAEDVVAYLEKEAKTFYAYAVASPVIFQKPTVEMKAWAGELGNGNGG